MSLSVRVMMRREERLYGKRPLREGAYAVVLGINSAEVVIQHELEMAHAVGFNSKKRMLHGHDRSVYLEDRVVKRF